MGDTPKSGQRMPETCDPGGVQRSRVMDKESPNSCESFEDKAIVPLTSDGYLKDAAGQP
jgi:hypothetical protein